MDLKNTNIFISYRHFDSAEYAKKLLSKLKLYEPSCNVFLDKSSMTGGFQFLEQIKTELSTCEVLLLLISPYWNTSDGLKRLYDPEDVLLREIKYAKKHVIMVLPILIEGAQMPEKKDLPENIRWLQDHHGIPLSTKNVNNDFLEIVRIIGLLITEKKRISNDLDNRMRRLKKLFKENPDQWSKELQKEVDLMKQQNVFPTFIEVKSKAGEGIKKSDILLPGEWKCVAKTIAGKFEIRFIIEDSDHFNITGKIKVFDIQGSKLYKTKIEGNWAKALDTDRNLFMGLFLSYITDEDKHEQMLIPFHRIVGNAVVGTDETGVQFVCKNICPRPFNI